MRRVLHPSNFVRRSVPLSKQSRKIFKVTAGPYTLELGKRTRIMGIVNLTPDSFSGDGCLTRSRGGVQKAAALAETMVREGADLLDLGGESTRPGSRRVCVAEEIRRVIPVVKALAQRIKIPLSVDTYKTIVAQHALDAGAVIINNIMGTKKNKSLLKMVRDYDAAIVLMHIRGIPSTMQRDVVYRSLFEEIAESLEKSIENCLEIGIRSDRIIIDPGLGFGKGVEHNLQIINRLKYLSRLNQPILIGASRKSFIGKVLNQDGSGRLWGSLACVCAGILNGAHIFRVHDVCQTKQIAVMTDAIINETG